MTYIMILISLFICAEKNIFQKNWEKIVLYA